MKITALLVLKSPGDSSSSSSSGAASAGEQQAVVLANASDVSPFGYFQRPAAREFIVFVARTVALRTPVLEEYQKTFGESWRTTKADATQPWQYLNDALTKYQDPAEADKLLKIQRDLDETKIILHKTIDSVLARGERLDSLVEKSSDLSAASQMFYKQAKKANSCCTIL
ncbi:VAMP-like protein YKT61 [Dichanthelium oligosanthes]|uniref:VAMP-like protein YKT61 n=1 Tax=Dichanthelium oligosanthes TaxID=888268 RepID=A0A1E5VHD8_9POAL|nr:VAMP-like protein YKT61 [Dichanthelium oligosanthes]